MKRKLTLLVLMFALTASAQEQRGGKTPGDRSKPEAVDVNSCELLEHPKRYGKIVRVSAVYTFGFEWSYLSSSSCSGHRIWVDFDENYTNCTKRSLKGKLHDKKGFGKEVNVTFIGRMESCGGCGHMGAYQYRFVVQCVERSSVIHPN